MLQLWRASSRALPSSVLSRPPSLRFAGLSTTRLGFYQHVRTLRLLRRDAQARLTEAEEGKPRSCIVISPEGKNIDRSGTYNSLFPCPQESRPPRIEHLLCLEDGNVVEVLSKALDLPTKYVEELVGFGAVYHAIICPTPPDGSLSKTQWELYKKFSALSRDKKRPALKGKTIPEAQKTRRIASICEGVEAGSYLRVHVHVKRFPRCYEVDWKSRIIVDTESYVVLNKPAGIPVGSAVDNTFECCAIFAAHAIGRSSPLILTHQIDNCTEGCVVLAKTKEFCSDFNMHLRNKEVHKSYLALAAGPVPVGRITHYMRLADRHPRILSSVPLPGWAPCELEVFECKKVSWPTEDIEKNFRAKDCGWEMKDSAYECRVQLLTGRTHQIRAQFAALNAPLIGDSMYMPPVLLRFKCPEVYPLPSTWCGMVDGIEDDIDTKEHSINECAFEEWVAAHGPEPEYAIGLQASEISWNGGKHHYKAQDPWWRQ